MTPSRSVQPAAAGSKDPSDRGRQFFFLVFCLCALTGSLVRASTGAERLVPKPLPGLRAEVATLIMQGASGGALDLALATGFGAQANQLELTLEVSGAPLLGAVTEETNELKVELYIYVVSGEGSVVGHSASEVELAVERWGERLSTGGLRIADQLALAEASGGSLSIRALALVPSANLFGLVVADVEPRDAAGASARLRFEDSCADWISVADSGAEARSTSARPLWTVGQAVSVEVVGGGLGSGDREVVFRRDSDPEVVSPARLSGHSQSGERFVAELEVPSLESGIYSFSVRGSKNPSFESKSLQVWVLNRGSDPEGLPRSCSWPQVMELARQEIEQFGPVLAEEGAGSGSHRRRLARGYRELLLRFGAGRSVAKAVSELVDWEQAAVEDDLQKNFKILLSAQLEVLTELAERQPESLLPLFKLHQLAYREHFLRRQFGLSGHSRRLAATIAETGLEAAGDSEGPSWSADALVALAEIADRHRMFAASQSLLERAIEIEPDNQQGRLLLSMLYEKLGVYDAAAAHLEHLVASSPAVSHGWLRLAIMEQRLGRKRNSRRALERVIGQSPEPWLLSLAYQALVKSLFSDGEFGEGLARLEEAEMLLPRDSALALARAYGLDRLGRTMEAVEVLRKLEADPSGADSPRLHYSECAAQLADQVNRRLRRAVTIRQPLLRVAIEAGSS